jgi:KAP-like P-loop domain-containing protein
MSAADPSGGFSTGGLEVLGVDQNVEFAIGRTPEPWTLPLDMLMISVDQFGVLGKLGQAVQAAMPELDWDGLDFHVLEPESPQLLRISNRDAWRARPRLANIAVATVRYRAGLPATVDAAARATISVINMAQRVGVEALGLPLLGTDAAGLPVGETADYVVPRAVEAASRPGSVRRVVFVCRDTATEHAIRAVWARSMGSRRPVAAELPLLRSDAEELLGFTLAVMLARDADRATALDVLLGVFVRPVRSRFRTRGLESGSTSALLRALPDDRDRRIDQALTSAGIDSRRFDVMPVDDLEVPRLADVVTVAGQVAQWVGSARVLPHHVAAAAVGGLLREPAIPQRVLTALGLTQRQLRDALRDAVEVRWPDERAEQWAAIWAAGERALAASRLPPGPRYADVLSDAESADDRLGIAADVNALAALLAATTTPPPLSVALLGRWGSGKSTFMNLMHQRVAALSQHAATDWTSRFSPMIRQVRFNAWHYSDDHVWVGLIEHLFHALRERDESTPASNNDLLIPKLETELQLAQNRAAKLDDELARIDELEPGRGWWGWLWQPHRLVLIMRAARRQASHGLTAQSVLTGAFCALAAAAVIGGVLTGSRLIAWFAAIPAVAALVTPAVAAWTRARKIADAVHQKLLEDKKRLAADIESLTARLDELDPVRGLNSLVNKLASGDRYESFRGLAGRIHQDLTRLDRQMSELDDPRQRQRIVLYIDDLDRCTSDRVIQVLQAVNLLLSMPLFVVVVAVDPQWLLDALQEHYGQLGDERGRALDYLDKIFHIAFAVRPMNNRAGDYLRSLLPDVESGHAHETVVPAAGSSTVPAAPHRAAGPAPAQTEVEQPGLLAATDSQGNDETATTADPDGLVGQELRIRQVEADFLPRIAALLDTPRAVKKAVNLYLLLRATIPDSDLDAYLGDERGGPFQAAALLVAGVVSCPAEASDLLGRLIQAKPEEPIGPVLRSSARSDSGSARPGSSICLRLAPRIDELAEEFPLLAHVSAYRRWARTVARYSFESFTLFGDELPGDDELARH